MRRLVAWLRELYARRPGRVIKVASVQPLGAGVTLYAIDIDGRRLVIGACARSVCVLDRYPAPPRTSASERELTHSAAK